MNTLLEYVGQTPIPETTAPFVAEQEFRKIEQGGICCIIDSSFYNWFSGLVEDPVAEGSLHIYKLRGAALVSTIIPHFGVVESMATSLAQFHWMLANQFGVPRGPITKDACSNLFHIPDVNNIVRSVMAVWASVGWSVSARELSSLYEYKAKRLVFSANPTLDLLVA